MNESKRENTTVVMQEWEIADRLGFPTQKYDRIGGSCKGLHTFCVVVSNTERCDLVIDTIMSEIKELLPLDISQSRLKISNRLSMEIYDMDNIRLRVRLGVEIGYDTYADLSSCPFYKVEGEAPKHWAQLHAAPYRIIAIDETLPEELAYASEAPVRVDQFSLLKDFI